MGRAGSRLVRGDRPARAPPQATAGRPLRVCTSPPRLPPWCQCPASSLFDEPASRHLEVVEMVVERAKRLVESRYKVVILLESITRLGRASSAVVPSRGQVLSGAAEGVLSA